MAADDEGHLPANMVSCLLAQPAAETAVQERRFCAAGMSFRFGSVSRVRATDSQETSCLSPRTGYRFGLHS
jgi:hypothetical protein